MDKGFKIANSCKLLQISRLAFYYKNKPKNTSKPKNNKKVGRPIPEFSMGINNCQVDDSIIETLLHDACERYPFYGYKKITQIIRKKYGLIINKKKVYRLFKKLELLLPYIRHTKQGQPAQIREVTGINQVWPIDIKYVKAINGQFIMLTHIVDTFSRKLVHREITKTATTNDALTTVKRALIDNKVTEKLVLRSDNGQQFTSVKFEHLQ